MGAAGHTFDTADQLWFGHSAKRWEESLPLGNGRLGAMVEGSVAADQIHLNEETLWAGGHVDRTTPDAAAALDRVRDLLASGEYAAAEELIESSLTGSSIDIRPYQPLGTLSLAFPDHEESEDYRRTLDLSKGLATIAYRVGYARECCPVTQGAGMESVEIATNGVFDPTVPVPVE